MSAGVSPIRVAIIGGGCAGVTAAFELTRPEHRGRYQVTIYQLGWRLGGKGASGRGPADRIEEHGLHLWMGFYENAFRVMRECYAELARDPQSCRIADWRDAFVPDPHCGVMDHTPDGRWLPWTVLFPATPGLPGDPDPRRWTVLDYLTRCVTLVRSLLEAIQVRGGLLAGDGGAEPVAGQSGPGTAGGALAAEVGAQLRRWFKYGRLATLGGWLEAMNLVDMALRRVPGLPESGALRLHELLAGAVRNQLQALVDRDDELRRLWEIVDLVLAVVRGSIRCGLATDPRGFEAIDDHDCKQWLIDNGASPRSVDSAFVRALYDLAFAYEDGDVSRPRIAAGQALRGALRAFFTYRGAFFWKMQSGMGDVVFAPFYEVLARRGVRFEFFHRLERIRSAPASEAGGRPHVAALEFDVQARPRKDYHPLVDVRGLPCWPSRPDFSQLEDGARLEAEGRDFESGWDRRAVGRRTLQVGQDFDLVVLAVGVGAVAGVSQELAARSPRWQTMLENARSVSTQALQLWLQASTRELGFLGQPINVSGFVEPFDTWADMSHLVREESFAAKVGSVAYFCSVLPDPAGLSPQAQLEQAGYPERRRQEVLENAKRFLSRDIRHLWPRAVGPDGQFRWDLLVAAEGEGPDQREKREKASRPAVGPERLATQYWSANVNPSDRYALSLPGTLRHRMSPLEMVFDNLTVAGDWTDAGFNEGCVEAAVMSGRLAAHALSGAPALEDIVGFDHP